MKRAIWMNLNYDERGKWDHSVLGATFPATAPHSPPLSGVPVSGSLSAVVMKQLKMLTVQSLSSLAASGPLIWLIPRHNFQRSAISGTLPQHANLLGLGLPQLGWLRLGLCLGASSFVMPGALPWRNSSSSMPFWEVMGLLFSDDSLVHLLCLAEESSLSPMSNLTCIILFLHIPSEPGERGWFRV